MVCVRTGWFDDSPGPVAERQLWKAPEPVSSVAGGSSWDDYFIPTPLAWLPFHGVERDQARQVWLGRNGVERNIVIGRAAERKCS